MKTMFKSLSLAAFALLIASVSGCGKSKSTQSVPEFDGGYVKTDSGDFVQLNATRAYTTGVGRKPSSLGDYITGKVPLYYYTPKLSSAKVIDGSNLKGLEVKGQYQFKDFSLHLLKPMVVDGDHDIFYHNKGPATEGHVFYVPGTEIETQRKSTGPDSYYFQPRPKLKGGAYVAWMDNTFWLFRIPYGTSDTASFNGLWVPVKQKGHVPALLFFIDLPKITFYQWKPDEDCYKLSRGRWKRFGDNEFAPIDYDASAALGTAKHLTIRVNGNVLTFGPEKGNFKLRRSDKKQSKLKSCK